MLVVWFDLCVADLFCVGCFVDWLFIVVILDLPDVGWFMRLRFCIAWDCDDFALHFGGDLVLLLTLTLTWVVDCFVLMLMMRLRFGWVCCICFLIHSNFCVLLVLIYLVFNGLVFADCDRCTYDVFCDVNST